jgi:hypothetical protein
MNFGSGYKEVRSRLELSPYRLSHRPPSCSPHFSGKWTRLCSYSPFNISITSAPADPTAQNFHPATEGLAPGDLFAELKPEDNHWLCAGGFVTETQIWYQIFNDGTFVMCQVLHSSVGSVIP